MPRIVLEVRVIPDGRRYRRAGCDEPKENGEFVERRPSAHDLDLASLVADHHWAIVGHSHDNQKAVIGRHLNREHVS
jgi:hypothetical protein